MSDVVRPCGKGPGLVPPAPRLPVRSMLSAPSPPPPPPQGPGRIGVFRAALSAVVPALWAAILGGPSHGKVTTGGGRPVLRLRGEGSCGGGGAPRDSAGSGATEEGLTSRGGRNLRLPLRFGLRQGLVPLRWDCALPSPNAPGKALESREGTRPLRRVEEGLSRSFSGGGGKPSNIY